MPGPGNYNPQDLGKTKPPAFSMRIKPEDPSSRFKGPGPGSYNPRVDCAKENQGAVKIGTSTRDQGKAMPGSKDAPGPGQYTVGTSLSGPAFGIGTS